MSDEKPQTLRPADEGRHAAPPTTAPANLPP
jgi:hypothetical protein